MEANNRQEVQHGRRGVARRPGGDLGGLEVEQKPEKVSETLVGRRGRIKEG